jgi:ubiquinone/menaquinone biosynthesis C-methylase UbiE
VKEIRICFIGLSKLITKDNSFMFYTISVNFRNFSEICDCL